MEVIIERPNEDHEAGSVAQPDGQSSHRSGASDNDPLAAGDIHNLVDNDESQTNDKSRDGIDLADSKSNQHNTKVDYGKIDYDGSRSRTKSFTYSL